MKNLSFVKMIDFVVLKYLKCLQIKIDIYKNLNMYRISFKILIGINVKIISSLNQK